MMTRFLLLSLACAAAALPQSTAFLKDDTFRGQPAWALSNGLIRVTFMAQGGHLAEMRLISADPKVSLNPLLSNLAAKHRPDR
jgi:hypothetical protein